jgi:hypothetical protein
VKDDDVVDPVEELGLESGAHGAHDRLTHGVQIHELLL